MRKKLPKILITGGAGFIGSAFVKQILNRGCYCKKKQFPSNLKQGTARKLFLDTGLSPKYNIIIIDKLTYAGDLKRLAEVKDKYKFYKTDICDRKQIEVIFNKEKPDAVVHFAAESHVDRSIVSAQPFIETNIIGTEVLLAVSRKHGIKRFIHISTDEVYGDIERGEFFEDSPLKPNSPYSASKAAADLLVNSYIRTYNFPAIIVRPSNNYGPWQYPEKLIPLAILKILNGKKVPVYAQGKNIREWLYVDDCAAGIISVLEKGKIGEVYNLGSGREKKNIDAVKAILKIMNADPERIEFVKDRPGHDIRYRLNSKKITRATGWRPKANFEQGLVNTISWYLAHKNWLFSKQKEIEKFYTRR